MPDISMCSNKTCPLKKDCYRYTAKPSEFRQSYSNFSECLIPSANGWGCSYFISNQHTFIIEPNEVHLDKINESFDNTKYVKL